MPKLDKNLAKAANESEDGGFSPVPDGIYPVKLNKVDTKEGPKGPYWVWEFEVTDGDHAKRRFWLNTSLSEAALWKLNETFKAFGVTADTDTDELVGKVVSATISTRTIQSGPRAGEETNQIEAVHASSGSDSKTKADLPF